LTNANPGVIADCQCGQYGYFQGFPPLDLWTHHAGWSSNNKYSLMAAYELSGNDQYELAAGLAIIGNHHDSVP